MDLHSLAMVNDDPEDGRWEAFVRRDPGADGQFVVAVDTTCIYCRPTCPARRPLRKNVRFLPDAAAAERQGYRACKRCRPELTQRPAEAMVDKVKALLVADLEAPPGLDALARTTGISPAHLQKTFKKHTGLSPKEFVAAARLERWKAQLRAGKPVTEAWLEAGYGSAGRAYAAARRQMGMSPAQYGKGGAGAAHPLDGARHAPRGAAPRPDRAGTVPGGVRRQREGARVPPPLRVPQGRARAAPRLRRTRDSAPRQRPSVSARAPSTCPSTSRRRASSARSGRRSGPSPPEAPPATPRWRAPSAIRRPPAPSPGPARRTRSPSRCPATGSSTPTEASPVTAGGRSGSRRSLPRRERTSPRRPVPPRVCWSS